VIGNGLVVDPIALVEELEGIRARGIAADTLELSDRAQLIFVYHKRADALNEKGAARKIGTTGRGIGPAYCDKMRRSGIRGCDLCKPEILSAKFRAEAARYNKIFAEAGAEEIDIEKELALVLEAAAKLAPLVRNTAYSVAEAVKQGKNVLCEGAQGGLLDVDHGTYPFVTSSNTISGGACTGAGIPPTAVRNVYGVIKAYTTRVGEGPFPTELFDADGELLRARGREFGATTGRPRRCGWFDAVAARYSCMLSGVNKLLVTKLDVLDEFDEIAICTAYEIDGVRTDEFPAAVEDLEKVKPVYEMVPGWKTSLDAVTSVDQLPEAARKYLARMAELIGADIEIISVGPRRDQTFKA
jgi:adenylosuccinate synthase